MDAPCAAVPSPGGRPVPSARISMSQRAASAELTGLPRCGLSSLAAKAGGLAIAIKNSTAALRIGMGHLAFAVHRPACDGIAVMMAEGGDGRLAVQCAARRDELGTCGLERAVIVPGAALQDGGCAAPAPGQAETGEGLGPDRRLKGCFRPAFTAIGGDHHLGDTALAGIGDAGSFVDAGLFQVLARRWPCDEGFDLIQEGEVVGFSFW